jgi:hypothetical protein
MRPGLSRRRVLGGACALASAAFLAGCTWPGESEAQALAGLRFQAAAPLVLRDWNASTLPGPYRAPARGEVPLRAFTSVQRVVATYYFYWYNVNTGLHTQGACGALTLHPPTMRGFSTLNPAWHAQQMADMHAAGIDVALPVYWGNDTSLVWSQAGLQQLVIALEAMDREGMRHPQIGMFFDTSGLLAQAGAPVDITVDPGRAMFLNYVRSFYSLVPPRQRALIDGRPIVWLYAAAFVSHYTQAAITTFAHDFAAEFGATPYIVRENSWAIQSDDVYAWGAASAGPNYLGVLEVGPGFDNTALTCEQHLIVHRKDGAFYRQSWDTALAHGTYGPLHHLAAVETWNELHEGTGVCQTAEYGRLYIELTRLYADRFHALGPIRPDSGPYAHAASVSYTFGKPARAAGLTLIPQPDGPVTVRQLDGRWAGVTGQDPYGGQYIYLGVDPSFAEETNAPFTVAVTYLDAGPGSVGVQYDSNLDIPPFQGAYAPAQPPAVVLEDTGTWRTAQFSLPHAYFGERENGGAGFRVVAPGPGFAVSSVTLRRVGAAP